MLGPRVAPVIAVGLIVMAVVTLAIGVWWLALIDLVLAAVMAVQLGWIAIPGRRG